ncbi:MAG TPA: amino acid adenylation domain-containing protein [Pyrinomonadaceae bacterium]|nr:amino acid adenylation domain-containing protein [Pyrinomonadaceae bacterium]
MSEVEISNTASEDVFVFPLSFAQQRLWFVQQMDPASSAYNMPMAFRLSGRLDVAALEWALNEIIRRHEILRTTFEVLDQQPVQMVAPSRTLKLSVTNLGSLPAPLREEEAERFANEESQRPFDLARGPLIRTTLLQLWPNEHVLLLTIHHIVSDGWSQSILMNELSVLYEARVARRASPLPELPIQYADFAEWQREWLSGAVLDQQIDYWRKHLSGAPPSLELPTDRPRPAVQSFNGARESFNLSRNLSVQLAELSRREDATLFMTLLAAFEVLLYRYTGQSDIVVGTPVANRNRKELEGLIGFFVNTLALRTDLSGDPTFRELLARVRETSLGAYANQDLPFEMLVEELRPVRDPSRNPIFQVIFALQNMPEADSHQSDLIIKPVDVKTGRAQFDLALDVTEFEGQIHASLIYNTDLFDAPAMQLMAEHFKVLLAGLSASVDKPISALPLLTEAESRRLLVEWNDTHAELGKEVRMQRLFETQVERTPAAIALVFEGRRVTYEELNRRANRVAHYLMGLGVGPESLVGLMMERSIEMIVGLLGILKAGGAYVPLDPASPLPRLAQILDDARISVLLTDTPSSVALPSSYQGWVSCLDVAEDSFSQQPDRNPPCRTTGDNAAYVIYTSGSTGTPKGVLLAHRGVCNVVAALVQRFAIDSESCVLQFASLSFDASVEEIFTALTTGARLCLARRETLLSAGDLVELAQAEKVTVATMPPSLLAVLSPENFPMLETMCSAGERCPAEVAARWSKGIRFVNGYGPTETTVIATTYERGDDSTGEPPIGRPVSNTLIYILDQALNLVPTGAAGELHIGGVGLARGYLDRPDLTAAKFIPNPFSTAPGARLYKTGDVARYLPDGNVRFLGRRDEQLKLRGFRIEPGEIEAMLREHEAVLEVAVLAGEDRRGDKCLVAYVVPKIQMVVTGEELRAFAQQRVPEYMVPSSFVLLDELPLLTNGKLDRVSLAAQSIAQVERVGTRVGPRNLFEAQLAEIWEELLQVEPDVRDNFFELGGHSLLVVQLLERVERITGKRVNVASLFNAPTIEALAQLLGRQTNLTSPSPLVAIQPQGTLTPCFFVHPAGGSVLPYIALSRALGRERPFYALEGTLGERQIELMAARYLDAVRAVRPDGPYLLGGWSTGGVVAFEMARQLEASGAQVALLDSVAPGAGTVVDGAALITSFFLNLGVPVDLLEPPSAQILQAGREEQLDWVLDQAQAAQLLPPDMSPLHLRHLFDLYQSDINAVENYRPAASPVSLLLLRAADEGDGGVENPEIGWSRLSTKKLEVHNVPGDHLTMMRPPHVSTLAEILRKHFAQADER